MAFPLQALLRLQLRVNTCFLDAALSAVRFYAAAADPRPDLAVPARTERLSYAWWW